MKCYVHHEEEAVVNCAKCGVAMCHACEEKALFRTANGTGQAMCPRCSLNEAQSIVDYESKWLKKRAIKLGLCALFILWGLIEYFTKANGLYDMFAYFLIAAIIINLGGNKKPQSIGSQVYNATAMVKSPVAYFIGWVIGYMIFAPIGLVMNIIGYIRTRTQYKKDLEILSQVQEAVAEMH